MLFLMLGNLAVEIELYLASKGKLENQLSHITFVPAWTPVASKDL